MENLTTDVLVVGAGPAGLTAAATLARLGVPSLTVTKYGGTADSPRAHITNQRAVEIFRDLGIERRVMAASLAAAPHGQAGVRHRVRRPRAVSHDDVGNGRRSPGRLPRRQPVRHVQRPATRTRADLARRARFRSAPTSASTTRSSESAKQPTPSSTRVRNRVDGRELEIRSRYAIGCDGARTIVGENGDFRVRRRRRTRQRHHGLDRSRSHTLYQAPLRSAVLHLPPRQRGRIQHLDLRRAVDRVEHDLHTPRWRRVRDLGGKRDGPSARSRSATPRFAIRIKKISEWQFNHVVAGRYRDRRLFLAGDAAHRHPPANGLGSNTSIQDSYNLAWKLALVTSERASDRLLDSYHDERQPVGRRVVDRANQSVGEMFPFIEALGFRPDQTPEEGGSDDRPHPRPRRRGTPARSCCRVSNS